MNQEDALLKARDIWGENAHVEIVESIFYIGEKMPICKQPLRDAAFLIYGKGSSWIEAFDSAQGTK